MSYKRLTKQVGAGYVPVCYSEKCQGKCNNCPDKMIHIIQMLGAFEDAYEEDDIEIDNKY